MALLMHATTRQWAEQILAYGPDSDFVEPGGGPGAESFSTCLGTGPFRLGTPPEYAERKAAERPHSPTKAALLYSWWMCRTPLSRSLSTRCISRSVRESSRSTKARAWKNYVW